MENLFNVLCNNVFLNLLVINLMLDIFLGVGRVIKEGRFNSCVGIDGAIRKVAMLICVFFLKLFDMCININFIFMIPAEYVKFLGITSIGLCEFFAILFSLYEFVSVLKNMILCGLPVPLKIKDFAEKLLNNLTNELEYTDKYKDNKAMKRNLNK